MDKILEFLDFSSLDPQLYWRVQTQDGSRTYEISWRRDGSIHWRFREMDALFWTLCDVHTLLPSLRQHGIDMESFEGMVKNTLSHQACFADRVVKDSRTLLGTEVVDKAIVDHQQFLDGIEAALSTLELKEPPRERPKLRVIRD